MGLGCVELPEQDGLAVTHEFPHWLDVLVLHVTELHDEAPETVVTVHPLHRHPLIP